MFRLNCVRLMGSANAPFCPIMPKAAITRSPRTSLIPLHRRWVSDIVHFGMRTHPVGVNRIINVSAVAAARKQSQPLVAWAAIWIKAVALASRDWPELRTAYLPYPWPRMYVHPHTVASVVVERAVFIDKLRPSGAGKRPQPSCNS